jgi:flagellar protein FlaJ
MDKEKKIKASKLFLGIANKLVSLFPQINIDLIQSDSDLTHKEHIAYSLYSSIYITLMILATIITLGIIFDKFEIWTIGFYASPVIYIFTLFSSLYKPKIVARRKAREIEKDLPYAMRHLLIQIKSGIPLYQGLVAISEKYGTASKEIKKIVSDINSGKSQIEAIENSIFRNPSKYYRRSFWQILSALKTGTSLESNLECTVDDLLKQQLIDIKKYGQELNPLTLMYMMIAVILPSLGITFLIILSSFIGSSLTKPTFMIILFGLIIFQIMFMNLVRMKRPMVRI